MPKSSRRTAFGTSTGKGQTVTVIEAPRARSQRRKAIVAFWVTWFTVGLLTGTVASHYLYPILGGLLGIVTGAIVGVLLAALIIAWPVLMIIWHWLPELVIGWGIVYGWVWFMLGTPLWLSLVVVGQCIGFGLHPRTRRWVMAPVWCLIVRHRLRQCFAAFIISNTEGTLPLILAARPTPVGERVWVWLRPGLSIQNLEQDGQVQKLAVACWAREVRVTPASRKYAALVRVDVTRRETLTSTVVSPLPGFLPSDMPATTAATVTSQEPVGVNLSDVPAPRRRSPDTNSDRSRRNGRHPEPPSSDAFDPSDYA